MASIEPKEITVQIVRDGIGKLTDLEKQIQDGIDNYVESVRKKELIAITEFFQAKHKLATDFAPKLGNLVLSRFREILSKDFYNISAMKASTCIVNSFFYTDDTVLSSLIKIKKWISKLRVIGNPTEFGIALSASLDNQDDMFILKIAKDKSSRRSLIHEIFVGLFALNALRAVVPNFAYIFGGFYCSTPVVDKNQKVVNWCSGGNDKNVYVVYENINPSISMDDYVRSCSEDEFLATFLQLLYALGEANRQCKFTHYDLHPNNILMREYQGNDYFQIRYNTENGQEYLVSNRIATIIDYGTSHIVYNQEHYGIFWPTYYVLPDVSNIFNDIYKCLMWTIVITEHNKPVNQAAIKIRNMFVKNKLTKEEYDEKYSSYFTIPVDIYKDEQLYLLTAEIRRRFNCEFISSKAGDYPILACTNGCPTSGLLFKELGINAAPNVIKSFLDYYNVWELTKAWPTFLHYRGAKINFLRELRDSYNKLKLGIRSSTTALNSPDTIDDVIDYLDGLASLLNDIYVLLLEIYVGQQVMKQFTEELSHFEYTSYIEQFLDKANNYVFELNNELYQDKRFELIARLRELFRLMKELGFSYS